MVAGILAAHVQIRLCFQLGFYDGILAERSGEGLVDGGFDAGGLETLGAVDEDEKELIEEGIQGLEAVCGDDVGRGVREDGIGKLLGDIAHLYNRTQK